MALHAVSVTGFEGPLDLLLELIEAEKLDVSAVALAKVTAQYLERLRSLPELPPDELAQFLVVASRLVLLKSRRLLPQLVLTPEEEEDIVSLEAQLREYQKFRAQSRILRVRWQTGAAVFAREGYLGVAVTFYPPPRFLPGSFHDAIREVIARLPIVELPRREALAAIITLEERIRAIAERVRDVAVSSFRETVGKGAGKTEVIVSFLALLELVKQRLVDATQPSAFRDILIRKRQTP